MSGTFCPKPDCDLHISGRCLEGFDPPESCPYLSELQQSPDEVAAYVGEEQIDLPSGEALTTIQANEVARAGQTQVVIIAGPYGSGKTTILTALFEAFQEAPFGNYSFRGSRTLVGFEKRCHLGRKESGRELADTQHTSMREGIVFLHLDLAFHGSMELEHSNLLLSDISGEMFGRLRDTSDAARDIVAFQRADHLCLVVDGERLINPEQRHLARNDSRGILRSIVESGKLASECLINVVITKWDLVVESMEAENAETIVAYIEETKRTIQAVAPDRTFLFHEIAARPPAGAKIPFAHGVPTLLRSWMGHETTHSGKARLYLLKDPRREIDRYTEATVARRELRSTYDLARF